MIGWQGRSYSYIYGFWKCPPPIAFYTAGSSLAVFFMVDWQQFLSEENFWQAWDKVRRNNGCAGVDGETIAQFKVHAERNLQQLRRSLAKGNYQPLPLRPLHIPKKVRSQVGELPKMEWRGLAVPTVRDRIVQQALLNLLHPLLEPQFEDLVD